MPVWEIIDAWLSSNVSQFILAATAAALLSFALSITALSWAKTLKKRYRKMMMGQDGLNLEGLLNRHGALIEEALHLQRQTGARLDGIDANLKLAVAGVSLVRYNAFRETGSDLSFSIALLDRNLDGIVLTSLFGREESRCYGKPIKQGESSYLLSEEEFQALDEARHQLDARQS